MRLRRTGTAWAGTPAGTAPGALAGAAAASADAYFVVTGAVCTRCFKASAVCARDFSMIFPTMNFGTMAPASISISPITTVPAPSEAFMRRNEPAYSFTSLPLYLRKLISWVGVRSNSNPIVMVFTLASVSSTCRVAPLSVTILASLQPGNHSFQRLKSAMISKRRSLGASIWNTDFVKWFSSFVHRGQLVFLSHEPDLQKIVGLDNLQELASPFALHLRREGVDAAFEGLDQRLAGEALRHTRQQHAPVLQIHFGAQGHAGAACLRSQVPLRAHHRHGAADPAVQ